MFNFKVYRTHNRVETVTASEIEFTRTHIVFKDTYGWLLLAFLSEDVNRIEREPSGS